MSSQVKRTRQTKAYPKKIVLPRVWDIRPSEYPESMWREIAPKHPKLVTELVDFAKDMRDSPCETWMILNDLCPPDRPLCLKRSCNICNIFFEKDGAPPPTPSPEPEKYQFEMLLGDDLW